MTTQKDERQKGINPADENAPRIAVIELTHRCNLRCYYCYQKEYTPAGERSLQEWKRIVKELAGAGCVSCVFSGGEPLLRDDVIGIVSYARYHNLAVSIMTNGVPVNEAMAREFKQLGVKEVCVSLHAAIAGLHDKLAHGPGSFQRALLAIRLLVRAGVGVCIRHAVSNANFGEYARLQKLAGDEGCAFSCDATILPLHKGEISPFALNHEQRFTFLKDMAIGPVVSCVSNPDEPSTLVCGAGSAICGIMPNGDVYPCILLPVLLGNAGSESFAGIWYGETSGTFRARKQALEESCKKCEKKLMCSRCHAVAFMENRAQGSEAGRCCESAAALFAMARGAPAAQGTQ